MVTHRRPSALRTLALMFALLAALCLVLGAVLSDAWAQTAPLYAFTKVADSTEDGFDPNNFGCAAINARGISLSERDAWPPTGSTLFLGSTGPTQMEP